MSADDALRWDARYADREVGEPAAPDALVDSDLIGLIPSRGRALDVACGAGAQAVWLARRGLDVVALDVSQEAIDLTRAAASAGGVADRVDARVVDLDLGVPPQLGSFDVIVCQRFRAVELYPTFLERLRPGGVCVVTVLSEAGADSPGAYHAPPGELIHAFDRHDVEVLAHTEGNGSASIVVRAGTANG